jgi:hypothetical protein
MKNSSHVFAGRVHSSSGPEDGARLREEWLAARAAHAELLHLGTPRVNLLLTGRDGAIEFLLDALLPNLREPIGRWSPGDRLLLPPPALIGTMIFQDVGAMGNADQARLLDWLTEASGHTQVISTTPVPLQPQVEAGRFTESLYYRLNIVSLDVTI